LPYATAMAGALRTPIALMIAAYISEIPEHGPWSDEMLAHPREICLAYLKGVADRIGVSHDGLIVKVAYPDEAILETARETGASLIVVSTHGRSGLGRWMYGSTAGHLLHESQAPLLVIGKEVPDAAAGGFAPKHVLVPLDGSALGEAAVPYALEAANAFGAKITFVRVAPLSVEAFPMMVPAVYWPRLDDDLAAGANAYLEKVRSSIQQPVEIVVLRGPRSEALLTFAEQNSVDLVVMTTHGHGGVQRAILGSTADRMLGGHAPVLLIRPGEHSPN